MAHRVHKINTEDTYIDLEHIRFISGVGVAPLAANEFSVLIDNTWVTVTLDDPGEAAARQNQLKNAWEDYRTHGGVSVTQPIS